MDIGLVVFLILLTQIIISTAIAGYYEFNIDVDEKKYGINTTHHDKYIGLIKLVEYDLNKIEFGRATKLGAFVYLMLLGLKYGILLNLGTSLSLIATIINITITNFKNNNFNLHADTDKLAVSEEDKIHYTFTKRSQKIECSICGNKFYLDKAPRREAYRCDVEKSMSALDGWGFKSRFGTYAEEICYVYDCPCGNHVAIYVITEQDIELTEDWSWDEGEHLEYRRTDYKYPSDTKFSENELSRLIDHTYNNIMREEIDSLDFIKVDYPCPMMYTDNLYPNMLSIWEKFRYIRTDTSPLDEVVRVDLNRKLILYLLELKFSIPRFKTMLIHSKLDNKVSMGLNGEYDHHIYQIQEMLCRWGYIGELDSDDI
jgi:hypothetical protein